MEDGPPGERLSPLPPSEGLRAIQIQNDALARLNHDYPTWLANLATVPLQDVTLAVQELERTIHELKLYDIEVDSNVCGVHRLESASLLRCLLL